MNPRNLPVKGLRQWSKSEIRDERFDGSQDSARISDAKVSILLDVNFPRSEIRKTIRIAGRDVIPVECRARLEVRLQFLFCCLIRHILDEFLDRMPPRVMAKHVPEGFQRLFAALLGQKGLGG